MKILIIKLSAIGDVVLALPTLEALKRRYPESEIAWVVEEAAADILVAHPLINRLFISHRKKWFRMLTRPSTFFAGVRYMIAFFRELRDTRYDIAIDLQGLFKSGMLIGLVRADRKIGFARGREFSSLFLNERLPAYDIEKHALERYLDVARHLGAIDPSPVCSLPISAELAGMRRRIVEIRKEGAFLVILNPVARWKTKLWPEQHFADLADRLIAERNALVIFTGSSDDSPVIARIRSLMKQNALDWAGETTLKELAALASLADLFVTTDTGPMHLAAAAGARVLALFGPTAPWRTGPYGSMHQIVRTGIECSPCFDRKCNRGIRCMEGISVDEVMKRVVL